MSTGGNLHGLYDVSIDEGSKSPKNTICEDFLIFCKLAVKNGVVPPSWNWVKFLKTAAGLLPYAFEKSDAKEKWGGENVFTAVTGGRSLHYTAEVVYGTSCMYGGGGIEEGDDGEALQEMSEQVEGNWKRLVLGDGELFADVGGVQAWKQLHSALRVQPATY